MNCEQCAAALQIDGRTRACEDGRGCSIPQRGPDGDRATDLWNLLQGVPDGCRDYTLRACRASRFDLELLAVIGEEMRGANDGG